MYVLDLTVSIQNLPIWTQFQVLLSIQVVRCDCRRWDFFIGKLLPGWASLSCLATISGMTGLYAFCSPVRQEALARSIESDGMVKRGEDRMNWSKKSEYYQEVRENWCSILVGRSWLNPCA